MFYMFYILYFIFSKATLLKHLRNGQFMIQYTLRMAGLDLAVMGSNVYVYCTTSADLVTVYQPQRGLYHLHYRPNGVTPEFENAWIGLGVIQCGL